MRIHLMKKILTAVLLFMSLQIQSQESFKQALREKTLKEIRSVIDTSAALTGLMVIDLTTGETIGINENTVFPTASTIKVPLLIEICKQAGQKKFSMTDIRQVRNADVVAGSGIIQALTDPSAFSIRNLCILMISISDNTATNLLIDLVGLNSVNTTMQSLGYTQTKLQRKMIDTLASGRGQENVATPAEAAKMLQQIYKGDMIDKAVSEQVLSLLKKCVRRNSRLSKGLPAEVPIIFKDGLLNGVSTEWAIVPLTGRPYAVVMMENFKIENQPSQSMEKVSGILYQYFWRLANSSRWGVYLPQSLIK